MTHRSVIRVLIADDHDPMRRGICHLLQTEPGVLVVGEAVNFRQLIKMAGDVKPDTLVMDLRMGDEISSSRTSSAHVSLIQWLSESRSGPTAKLKLL